MRRCNALLLLLCAACGDPGIPADLPAGDFVMAWEGAKTDVELGEPVPLRLWMRVADGIEASPPPVAAGYRELVGARLSPADDARWVGGDGARAWTQSFTLQWLRLGELRLPVLRHEARRKESGQVLSARTDELSFTVREVLPANAEPTAEVPPDLVVDAPADTRWRWIAGGVLGLGLLGVCVWRLTRSRVVSRSAPTVRPVPPDAVVLARLKDLEMQLRGGRIGGERLVLEASDALRHWLQDGLGLPALERTTEEFLLGLQRGARLAIEQRGALQAFLTQCDLVKFAAQQPDLPQCTMLLETAREFVLATRGGSAFVAGGGDG